jgi:hypothetical protein
MQVPIVKTIRVIFAGAKAVKLLHTSKCSRILVASGDKNSPQTLGRGNMDFSTSSTGAPC